MKTNTYKTKAVKEDIKIMEDKIELNISNCRLLVKVKAASCGQ